MMTEMEIEVDMEHPPGLGPHAEDEDLIDYDIDTSDHNQQATLFPAQDETLPDGPFFDADTNESVNIITHTGDHATEDDHGHPMEQDDVVHDDMHLDDSMEQDGGAMMMETGLLEDSVVGDADVFDGPKIDEAPVTDISFIDSRNEDDEITYEDFERENPTAAQGSYDQPENPLEVSGAAEAIGGTEQRSNEHTAEPGLETAPSKVTEETPLAILDDRILEPTAETERDEISWEQEEAQHGDHAHDELDDDRPDAENAAEAAATAAAAAEKRRPSTSEIGADGDSKTQGAPQNDDDDNDAQPHRNGNGNDDDNNGDDNDDAHPEGNKDDSDDDDDAGTNRNGNEPVGLVEDTHDRRSRPSKRTDSSHHSEHVPAITVQYNGHHFPFFSLKDQLGFFNKLSVLDHNMDRLFAGFREELSNEIPEGEILVFQVDELGLEFSEAGPPDSLSVISLRHILNVFNWLVRNQDPDSSRELSTYLFTRPEASKRYWFLVESAAAGKGLDEIIHSFGTPRPVSFDELDQATESHGEHTDDHGSSPMGKGASDEGPSVRRNGHASEEEVGSDEEDAETKDHEDENPGHDDLEDDDEDGSEYDEEVAEDHPEEPHGETTEHTRDSNEEDAEEDAEDSVQQGDEDRDAENEEEEGSEEKQEEEELEVEVEEEQDAEEEDYEEEDVVEDEEEEEEEEQDELGEERDPESLTDQLQQQDQQDAAIAAEYAELDEKINPQISIPDYADGNLQPLIIHGLVDEAGETDNGHYEDLTGPPLALEPFEDEIDGASAANAFSTNTLADDDFPPTTSAALDAGQILDLEAIEKEVMDTDALAEIDWRDEAELAAAETADTSLSGASKRARPDDEPIVAEEQDVKRRRS